MIRYLYTTDVFQLKQSLTDILETYVCYLGPCIKYVSGLRLKNVNECQHMS